MAILVISGSRRRWHRLAASFGGDQVSGESLRDKGASLMQPFRGRNRGLPKSDRDGADSQNVVMASAKPRAVEGGRSQTACREAGEQPGRRLRR